jgi:hypothetical protein
MHGLRSGSKLLTWLAPRAPPYWAVQLLGFLVTGLASPPLPESTWLWH